MDYHVNWDAHERNISEAFHSLRKDEHFCDVTLACEDRQFQAHKVVVSASSSFFEQILKSHKHPSPLIFLKGVEANHMELLLDFMYGGEVHVKAEELENFLKAGDEFGVKGLSSTNRAPESSKDEMQQSSSQEKEDQTEDRLPNHCTSFKSDTLFTPVQGLGGLNSTTDKKVASTSQDIAEDNLVKPDASQMQAIKKGSQWGKSSNASELQCSSTDLVDKHISQRSDKYHCKLCDYSSTHRFNVKKHVEGTHRLGVGWDCEKCGKHFKHQDFFCQHTRKTKCAK